MGFQVSPGVDFTEQDLTTSIAAVSTSIAAAVGAAQTGPVEEATLVNKEDVFVGQFGLPTNANFKDFFCTANFLAYSTALQFIRVVDDATALNAGATVAIAAGVITPTSLGVLIKNKTDYDAQNLAGTLDVSTHLVVAKFPGVKQNTVSIAIADASSFVGWAYEGEFTYAPTGDEFCVVVFDAGAIVERHFVTRDPAGKDYAGTNIYAGELINRTSQYIWFNESVLLTTTTPATPLGYDNFAAAVIPMGGGNNGTALSDADYMRGWALFQNSDEIDINLCVTGGASPAVGAWVDQNVAQIRKDCVNFVSPLQTDCVGVTDSAATSAVILTRQAFGNTSYSIMDCNYKYQYDRYNDVYRWVPLNGDHAGLYAYTDFVRDAWFSGAGYNRGFIKNVTKLAWNPKRTFRDELYKNAVNPIVSQKGQGTVLLGDKTLQTKPSAFDHVNVRRLFIVLEKAISSSAKYSLFELNNVFTRARFVQMVTPFLRDIMGRQGLTDFRVVCDESNNTGYVIDNNEFRAGIYLKPARSINYINLTFTAVATDVEFSEVIAK